MDNLPGDKSQDNDCIPEVANKRKRRFSSTQSLDESPKKKIPTTSLIHTASVAEENETAADKTHDDIRVGECANDVYDHSQISNEEQFLSQFTLDELCDEILYEIFKYVDTWSLMALMNVCERFQKFVLEKRLWENIDLSKEPLPLGILEDMLERCHDKTKSIKLRGPFPSQHIEGEIQHFNKTIQKSLTTRCTKLEVLELHGVTLNFYQITLKDFPQTLKRLVINICNIRMVSKKSLFNGIDKILVNLEELAIENNSWFDPYYIMHLSKLPLLRYLSLRGCLLMQQFIPYGSIAARHGFKKLEVIDLRDTPLNDSDLQSFNAVETLKEIYLQCPESDNSMQSEISSGELNNSKESDIDGPTTSIASATNANSLLDSEAPSTSSSSNKATDKNDLKHEKTYYSLTTPTTLTLKQSASTSSSSSSSSSSPPSTSLPNTSSIIDSNATGSTLSSLNSAQNIVPLVSTNAPSRSRSLPSADHIFYLDVRNRTSPNVVHINRRDNINLRHLLFADQAQQEQQQNEEQQNEEQRSPPPVIDHMMRRNLFFDIVNPMGRVVGNPIFDEGNIAQYNINLLSLLLTDRQQSSATISDRGICCFGRTRQPAQQGVIWIRVNNRVSENSLERFSIRDYKFVTDVALQHLVQCSPHLIFLDVSGTSVTLEGVQRFNELKPECKVVAEHLVNATNCEKTAA